MQLPAPSPSGYLNLTLHAHLPYVVNHGTWPHGLEWLLEAAAETYLPLLRMFRRLERDGVPLRCNLNLTPVLLEQLAHPVFTAEFPRYLDRKLAAAREDEAYFESMGESHYAELARMWQEFFSDALRDFRALDNDIVAGFRALGESGVVEIITSCATHGYLPLLGTDEAVRAQIGTAVAAHERHLGVRPRGIWVPECGYRPAGMWSFPVAPAGEPTPTAAKRKGVEQALSVAGLQFFYADTHLIEQSARTSSPYERTLLQDKRQSTQGRSLYRPYVVASPDPAVAAVTVFGRDPHTGMQVWSGDSGYPGDSEYLDFHKKRWPGGHRYWRVTGDSVGLADKQPYDPARAAERVRSHADHFVHTVWSALSPHFGEATPTILAAPFDAELFGHWWYEGIAWLEAVARIFHDYSTGIELTTAGDYLDRYPAAQTISMSEGSWGAGGDSRVWLNPETSWTYAELYAAELFCRDVCSSERWRKDVFAGRVARQLCRELLLLESSDWQFLITTGSARDYAEQRFGGHLQAFHQLRTMWTRMEAGEPAAENAEAQLQEMESVDGIFPDVDPSLWSRDVQPAPGAAAPSTTASAA